MKGVVVVSAFGRSHWLAVSLAKQGNPTTLIDVTESVGSWIPEEVEGPFGLFQDSHSSHLPEAQLETWHERFVEDDALSQLENGMTLWLSSGPVELKGPIINHRLNKLGIDSSIQDYIAKPDSTAKKKIESLNFAASWPAHLAHNLLSNVYAGNADSLGVSTCASLFSDYSVRLPTRSGHQRNLEWCEKNQVHVISHAKVKDLSLKGRKNIKGLEVQQLSSEKTQVIECDQLVWSLTSEETKFMNETLEKYLFPRGVLEPEWGWMRYRLKLSHSLMRDALPSQVIVIEDLGKPWTHSNLISLVRTGSVDFFDAWIRLPVNQRFNKNYLVELGRELVGVLRDRWSQTQYEITNYPLGFDSTYAEVGPCRQPVYDPSVKSKWKASSASDLWLDSVEQASGLGWGHRLEHQKKIHSGITEWWNKYLAKRKTENRVELKQ
jgi:hypothetical protein